MKKREEDQQREVGDNHQVYSKPICCLINRLLMLRVPCAGHTALLAPRFGCPTSHRGRQKPWDADRWPRLGPLNGRIKAGIKEWAPFFVLVWIPKQTHPPFCWKLHRTDCLQEQMVTEDYYWETPLQVLNSTHLYVSFIDNNHVKSLLIQHILDHNNTLYGI